jgi:clumping factor A
MIVVSLLLILVAVTLLVLGLTGGSSSLLISSIVASLLAAVFLVIGARQAAARRRTAAVAPDGIPDDPAHDPYPAGAAEPWRRTTRRRADEPVPDADYPRRADFSGAASGGSASARDDVHSDFSWSDTILSDGPASSDPAVVPDPDRRAGDAAVVPDPDRRAGDAAVVPDPDRRADDVAADARRAADGAGAMAGERQAPQHAGSTAADRQVPDYDRASSVIGSARAGEDDDQSWRRSTDPATESAETDEFAEPDADDPADEPLPQAVRPGDAVRMARIDAEVLVVDGRPRYHLADCPHLVGRLAEPLPAREAVELGFSPCGLCRPVDRLVAQAAHH